jgi:hypothetical protein
LFDVIPQMHVRAFVRHYASAQGVAVMLSKAEEYLQKAKECEEKGAGRLGGDQKRAKLDRRRSPLIRWM